MKRGLRILLTACIPACFFLFLASTDIGASFRLTGQLGLYAVFIPATTFLAYLVGTLGWRCCIDSDTRLPLGRLFMVRHVGNTITQFNPTGAIAGELFNAKMLVDEGIRDRDAYKSVALSRSLMILSQLTIFIAALAWLACFSPDRLPAETRHIVRISLFLLLSLVSSSVCLLLKKDRAAGSKKCRYPVIRHIKEMRALLAEYVRRRPRRTATALFLFSVQWFLCSLELYLILSLLGYGVEIWDGLFLDTAIIVLKSTAAFIPGQLGMEELANRFVLQFAGISSPDLWLSVSIIRRTRQLFWGIVALFFYLHIKRKRKSTACLPMHSMQHSRIARIDVEQLTIEKHLFPKLPKALSHLVKKAVCQDDINTLFANAPGKTNLAFIDSCMQQLAFTCHVAGMENLPPAGNSPLIFASNHPQGGVEAICIAHVLGQRYAEKFKFQANEFLTILPPLKDMFIPIPKHRKQSREDVRRLRQFYETDNHLVVFPAGATAYRAKGKITEHLWHKHFIKAAVEYRRDVVPLHFEARNSDIFYLVENFRKLIHSKYRFETLLFAREFFRQRGNTFTLHIGVPVPWQTFNKTKTHREWAILIQKQACALRELPN